MLPQTPQPNSKRYWGEERNIDSIYSIYLKKISYTYNSDISLSATHSNQNNSSSMKVPSPKSTTQSLQWETRQIKVLQAATLDHALKFILLINPLKDFNNTDKTDSPTDVAAEDGGLEEERNNVAHIIHVMFCTYRIYTNPHELMLKLMDYSDLCRIEQYRFVMHYWMDNYPEDFDYAIDNADSNRDLSSTSTTYNLTSNQLTHSHNNSITSFDSATTTRTAATTDSENSVGPRTTHSDTHSGSDGLGRRLSSLSLRTADERSSTPLISELLRLCKDEYIRTKAMKLQEMKSRATIMSNSETSRRSRHHNHSNGSKNSAILDLDSRYVAQQLTAIDLENFLGLKPYSLLEGTKTDKKIQIMVKNFNLLSKHVVITILRSHSPNIVASHWIAIAMNLRKIKNFNSLKAIIAGLTNESVYRLKQTVWSKIDRATMTNFKQMASIVDDVNNQTVLRQTQLIVEGTAKMSIEDESFGTIPYLGTFMTDLNMIDARYPTYVPSPKDETSKLKLINFEKCAKQFEILTQVQLLQKNVLASLHAIQRRNHFDEQTTLNRLKLEFSQSQQMLLAKPAIPPVSRLFENWFYDHGVATMTDKQCYEISVTLESNAVTR